MAKEGAPAMVEVHPALLFSGVGMISVGLVAMTWWAPKTRFRFFLYGGLLWAAAMAVKLLMDTTGFLSYLSSMSGQALLTTLPLSLYVGLRTGLLECGFPYLAGLKTSLRQANWRDIFAVGVGFGAFEAVLLGVQSFLNVAQLMLDPSLLETLPAEAREPVLKQLSYGAWIVPLPVLERVSALAAHLFATVLAVYAAKSAKPSLLATSILYKTALDASIPLLSSAQGGALVDLYLSEAYVGAMALVGALGLVLFKRYRVDPMEAGYLTNL